MTLQLDRIDRFVVTVPDAHEAHDAVARLGLTATSPRPRDDDRDRCAFSVGDREDAVHVELVTSSPHDRDQATDPCLLAFAADDVVRAQELLDAAPEAVEASGCRFALVERTWSPDSAPDGDFPLRRIDHLAILPADLDAATRYWVEVLGVPMHAQIDTATLVIRQMKVGDVIVELLAPASRDSHLVGMAPGMRPMIACEVDDVAACVGLARERGFTIADAAPGFLPGTLTATIAATELGGLALQLLQYV